MKIKQEENVLLKYHILVKRAYLELHKSKWSDVYGSRNLGERSTTFIQITKSKSNLNTLKKWLQVSGRDKVWKIHVMDPKFLILKFDTFWSSSLPINRDQGLSHSTLISYQAIVIIFKFLMLSFSKCSFQVLIFCLSVNLRLELDIL